MDPVRVVSADELRRLEECAREPIRTPGSIQSHGTLLGIDRATAVVVVASENAASWLGRSIAESGNDALTNAVESGVAVDPVRVTWEDAPSDAIVHRLDDLTIVELEPALDGQEYVRTSVVRALQRLAPITDIAELRRVAVAEIRQITGFDRVMAYHFFPDGHGEVVADDHVPELEPYLGLHFPASDIPAQARQLYLTNLCRAIVSTTDPGIPLVAASGDPRTIDLSRAELRSVSPHHLQYMRNMGQASTVSLSLVEQGELVGMITCAHRTERRLPVLLRRALEVLAGQLAMQLSSLAEIERLRQTVRVREQRAELLAPLYASDDIAGVLLGSTPTVLDLVSAEGVFLRLAGAISVAGEVPPTEGITQILELLDGRQFVSERFATEHPKRAHLLPGVAGLLVVPLGSAGDAIVFFRGEVEREISWLGDPGTTNRPDELSPRTSFSSWKESVVGRSDAWGTLVDEAAELGRELQGVLQRRTEVRLAELAMRDALTGVYNRRYLVERLEVPHPGDTALLFVDLDDFKRINDEYGHEYGDAVLAEVARRLTLNARGHDHVVRYGGDEFVVLCDGVTAEIAHAIAERIVEVIAAPILIGEHTVSVTGSCGVVVAPDGMGRGDLVDAADAAMYRAKRAGRNRVSV